VQINLVIPIKSSNFAVQNRMFMTATRKHRQKQALPLAWWAAVISIGTLVMNIPFLIFAIQNAECPLWRNLAMVLSLAVVILTLHYMVLYLLVYFTRTIGRVVVAIVNFLNAAAVYFIVRYHTMMDEGMMSNVFNTRWSEASGFMNWDMWLAIIIVGLLPAIWIVGRTLDRGSIRQMGRHTSIAFGIAAVVTLANMDRMLWFGKYDTELGGLVMPWSYIVNTGRWMVHQAEEQREETLLPDAHFHNNDPETVLLIIGESARRANCQLYGYEKETNPRLSQVKDLVVLPARSNATYTTAGLRAMMEHQSTGELFEILPNYLYRNGVDVQWRTSNWGETPLHIGDNYHDRNHLAEQYGIDNQYDGVLFCGLKTIIEQSPTPKQLLILHTSTSHGPEYHQQYPREYAYFNEQEVVGAYDNSLRYTDALLADLIDTLRTISNRKMAMIYMSDHGESLGENGIYMHGAPMAVAPRVQYEIPCYIWVSEGYRQLKPITQEVDQHGVFHSVMNLLSVETSVYNSDLDWFMQP